MIGRQVFTLMGRCATNRGSAGKLFARRLGGTQFKHIRCFSSQNSASNETNEMNSGQNEKKSHVSHAKGNAGVHNHKETHVHGPNCNHDHDHNHVHGPDCNHDHDHVHGPDCNHDHHHHESEADKDPMLTSIEDYKKALEMLSKGDLNGGYIVLKDVKAILENVNLNNSLAYFRLLRK